MKLPKLKYWYHATDMDTANKIIKCGYLLPQAHRGNITLGVFFANTMSNSGRWMQMRGITDYVVFKIPRTRFNADKMFVGGADKMPKELNMICMRYLDKVQVLYEDGQICQSPKFELPGVEIVNDGTSKLSMKISDLKAFESYIEANPELKKMIEKELELVK